MSETLLYTSQLVLRDSYKTAQQYSSILLMGIHRSFDVSGTMNVCLTGLNLSVSC